MTAELEGTGGIYRSARPCVPSAHGERPSPTGVSVFVPFMQHHPILRTLLGSPEETVSLRDTVLDLEAPGADLRKQFA
jgi:hypothetical protein